MSLCVSLLDPSTVYHLLYEIHFELMVTGLIHACMHYYSTNILFDLPITGKHFKPNSTAATVVNLETLKEGFQSISQRSPPEMQSMHELGMCLRVILNLNALRLNLVPILACTAMAAITYHHIMTTNNKIE